MRRGLIGDPDVDVVHVCTPNHLHVPLARSCPRGWQARRLREAARASTSTSAQRACALAADADVPAPPCRSSTATTRRCAKRVTGSHPGRAVPRTHTRHLSAGLAAQHSKTTIGASMPAAGGASRAFADIGVALVRPGRVRHRPSRDPRLSARSKTARACASSRRGSCGVRPPAGNGDGLLRPVSTEDAVVLQFETDWFSARLRRDQPDLCRPQEPAVARDRRLGGSARVRPGGRGVALGRCRDESADHPAGIPEPAVAAGGADTRFCPPVIRRAIRTASTCSSRTSSRRSRPARRC